MENAGPPDIKKKLGQGKGRKNNVFINWMPISHDTAISRPKKRNKRETSKNQGCGLDRLAKQG
jgi:hypothetical protein